jgi:hypothetical protein
VFTGQFPTHRSREFFAALQEFKAAIREISAATREPALVRYLGILPRSLLRGSGKWQNWIDRSTPAAISTMIPASFDCELIAIGDGVPVAIELGYHRRYGSPDRRSGTRVGATRRHRFWRNAPGEAAFLLDIWRVL